MKILILGRGGREHALGLRLSQDTRPHTLYFAPGNPGCADLGQRLEISLDDHQGLLLYAQREQIDLTIVGPEQPLADGIVDVFQEHNLAIFGPTQAGARIEASKAYAKTLMAKANIPTAGYTEYKNPLDAIALLKTSSYPLVIKEDGLAAGKGVTIAHNPTDAKQALNNAHHKNMGVILEDFLVGDELSVLALCDGERAIPLISAQDFKKALKDNKGPNTGGMGAYAPVPFVTESLMHVIQHQVLDPMMAQFKAEGMTYRGILYAGLMIDATQPIEHSIQVIEFNARFGDPETQVVLPLLNEEMAPLLYAASQGDLSPWAIQGIRFKKQSAVTVVLTAEGYPANYPKGDVISLPEHPVDNAHLIQAGTQAMPNQTLVTNGGRVINTVGLGTNLTEARNNAYTLAQQVSFKGKTYRTDIAEVAAKQPLLEPTQ